ncbi:MAG: hypothetical protein IJ567_07885 [Lachnospiraceae bacterium]|nr:hypothetical protein [Lachnospiraceae bacterium]
MKTKTYRIWLVSFLIVAIAGAVFYYMTTAGKNGQMHDTAAFVKNKIQECMCG